MNRFRAAYGREIEPMIDKTQWPQVDLPFLVGAPLANTTRNIHFYDENLNDDSKTVIEDRFL